MSQLYFKSRDELLTCSQDQLMELIRAMKIHSPSDTSVENLVDIIIQTREAHAKFILNSDITDSSSSSYYSSSEAEVREPRSHRKRDSDMADLLKRMKELEQALDKLEKKSDQTLGKSFNQTKEKFESLFEKGERLLIEREIYLYELKTHKEISNQLFKLKELESKTERDQVLDNLLDIIYKRCATLMVVGEAGWEAMERFEHAYPKPLMLKDPVMTKAISDCLIKTAKQYGQNRYHPYAHNKNSYMSNNWEDFDD